MTLQQLSKTVDFVQATTPSNANDGETWLDTSQSPPQLKVFDSSVNAFVRPRSIQNLDAPVSNAGSTTVGQLSRPSSGSPGDVWIRPEPNTLGDRLFRHQLHNNGTTGVAIESGNVITSSANFSSGGTSYVYSVSLPDASLQWQKSYSTEVTSLSSNNGFVAVGLSNGDLYLYNASDGVEQWSTSVGEGLDGIEYLDSEIASHGFDTVYLFDKSDGTELWSNSHGDLRTIGGNNKQVLTADGSGLVRSDDISDGSTLWSVNFSQEIEAIASSEQVHYLIGDSDELFEYGLNGSELNSTAVGIWAGFVSDAKVFGKTLLVSSVFGDNILALNTNDFSTRWEITPNNFSGTGTNTNPSGVDSDGSRVAFALDNGNEGDYDAFAYMTAGVGDEYIFVNGIYHKK